MPIATVPGSGDTGPRRKRIGESVAPSWGWQLRWGQRGDASGYEPLRHQPRDRPKPLSVGLDQASRDPSPNRIQRRVSFLATGQLPARVPHAPGGALRIQAVLPRRGSRPRTQDSLVAGLFLRGRQIPRSAVRGDRDEGVLALQEWEEGGRGVEQR